MNPHFSNKKLEDYISDESFQRWAKSVATEEEKRYWDEHYSKNSKYRDLIDQAKIAVKALSRTEPKVDPSTIEKSWDQLESRINAPAKSISLRPLMAYAAVIVLLAVGLVFWLNNNGPKEYLVYQADFGEKREVTLPDHSVVTLNANSELRVPADWNDGSREVWLKRGEAFFHIKKLASKENFIVHAEGFEVEVLGTKFNINMRTKSTHVLLVEGSVQVAYRDNKNLLSPGELAKLDTHRHEIEISKVSVSKYDSWLRNKLVFDNTTLLEISSLMKTHYGVDVKVDSELENRTITGEIPNDNLNLLIEALGVALDVQISRNDRQVLIKNKQP